MASFTITTDVNIDSLSGKAGGDTYTINGGSLTIDQDSRYGLNQTVSAILGAMTISATLGGAVTIDARYVRLIPFDSGSGNVPAAGTVISQGAVTGKLIGVWSAINVAPTASGSAMPASGWIKVKQVSQVPGYSAGALTGVGASATGADVAGWLEVVGQDSSTCTVPRLGSFSALGDWFSVGTTTGNPATTYQLPTSGSTLYIAGVFVAKTAGGTDYEFYPRVGSFSGVDCVATDSTRGKVCWITTAGVLQLGSDGTNTVGYCPPSGRAIVIPSILLLNATSAAKTVNALPNATLASRYDFTTTSGGAIAINKTALAWYPSFAYAKSVDLTDACALEQINCSMIGSPMAWSNVGVGLTAAQNQAAIVLDKCQNGGVFDEVVALRYGSGSCGSLFDCRNFTFNRAKAFCLVQAANTYSFAMTRLGDSVFNDCIIGYTLGFVLENDNVRFINTQYFDAVAGVSSASIGNNFMDTTTANKSITIDGVHFGALVDVQPNRSLWEIKGSGNEDITVQNIGASGNPLSMGSVAPCLYGFMIRSNPGSNMRVRRVYLADLADRIFLFGTTYINNITIENVMAPYAANTSELAGQNLKLRGVAATPSLTTQSVNYGTHFSDWFTSATTGQILLQMNEPSLASAAYITLFNGAAFTGQGGLSLPTVGMSAEFAMDWFAIGHSAFANSEPVMAGGTIGNYSVEYRLDKNDGSGFGAWTALTAANLSAETGIDVAFGVKLKVRITTTTTNTSEITSLRILTVSSAVAQAYQYPLERATVTLTGLVAGTEVHAYVGTDSASAVEIAGTESSGTTFAFEHAVGGQAGYITFVKRGKRFFRMPIDFAVIDTSIPIFQQTDIAYSNPA